MARKRPTQEARRTEISPSRWAVIVTVAVSALLVYAGFTTGNWRGVVVSEVQVLVVGLVSYLGLRE